MSSAIILTEMTNLRQISQKDPKRLTNLRNRKKRLIDLNNRFQFSQTSNIKIDKYYKCLLYVRRQIGFEELKNVRPFKQRLFLKNLLTLTSPIL